jgi:hypothetical protein
MHGLPIWPSANRVSNARDPGSGLLRDPWFLSQFIGCIWMRNAENTETLLILMFRCQIIEVVIRRRRAARVTKVCKQIGVSSGAFICTWGAGIFKTSSEGLGILGVDLFSARTQNIMTSNGDVSITSDVLFRFDVIKGVKCASRLGLPNSRRESRSGDVRSAEDQPRQREREKICLAVQVVEIFHSHKIFVGLQWHWIVYGKWRHFIILVVNDWTFLEKPTEQISLKSQRI